MENKQNLNINDNYTNFTNMSEFRVDVEAEMAEVDRLFSDSPTNHQNNYHASATNHQYSPSLEINDNYTNFTNMSEFRVDVEAEMAEVDRLFGDIPSQPLVNAETKNLQPITQPNNVQHFIPETTIQNTHHTDTNELTQLLLSLQQEINNLSINLSKIDKITVTANLQNTEIAKNANKTDELLKITKILFEKLNHIEHLLNIRS